MTSLAIVPDVILSYRLLSLLRRDAHVAFSIVSFTAPDIIQRRLMRITYGLYDTPETVQIMQTDPASVGILMNIAQSHMPDVAWLMEY